MEFREFWAEFGVGSVAMIGNRKEKPRTEFGYTGEKIL